MTVKELIEALAAMNPDALVVLQKDSEGNGYSPLSAVDDNAVYEAESTWSGEVYLRELTPDLEASGYCEEDLGNGDGVACVVLAPIN